MRNEETMKEIDMSENANVCPKCHAPAPRESRFCPACGDAIGSDTASVVDVNRCPSCGEDVDSESKYCIGCGALLLDLPAPAEPEPQDTESAGESTADGPVTKLVKTPKEEPASAPGNEKEMPGDHLPKAETHMVLRVVSQEDYGREFPVARDVVGIGKESDADIALTADDYVSHAHARVAVRGSNAEIEDLGSRNGTFVEVRGRHVLLSGDRVLIGTTVLEYCETHEEVK